MGVLMPKIAELREKQGLTQRQLADVLDVTDTTIANWERGRRGIEWVVRVAKLCDVLRCEPSDLFEEESLDGKLAQFASLPWLPLDERLAFPRRPAIYFAIDADDQVQYIGKSVDPKQRWSQHHRYKDLESIGQIRVAYLFVEAQDLLLEIEAALIQWFDPPLNAIGKTETQGFSGAKRIEDVSAGHNLKNLASKGVIEWKLAVVMAEQKMTSKRLRELTGLNSFAISKLKNFKPERLKIETLDLLCQALNCQPGDLLVFVPEEQGGQIES